MLKMDQVHVLRHKVLNEGQSIRRVARELGLSRNTVAKYLDQPEPIRSSRQARERPVWEAVQPRLEELVAEWEPRTTAKQRLTAMRLHRQLRAEGYQVGRTLVGDYWRERRRQRAEVYVPLINRPGEAQIDFFEVVVEVGGERRKAWEFLMRLMYSGREFAWLYERCDQLAFLDGHVRAFAHLDGVARRCVYDNLAAAVRKIVGARRELTGRFLAPRRYGSRISRRSHAATVSMRSHASYSVTSTRRSRPGTMPADRAASSGRKNAGNCCRFRPRASRCASPSRSRSARARWSGSKARGTRCRRAGRA
jgi:transposase